MRKEHDFIGELEVPEDVYYGVQTMRAIDNFHITGQTIDPDFIQSIAMVKKASALANMETGRLPGRIGIALTQAADEIIDGKLLDQFPVDPIQGGAGTSINMNMNEVLSNRALEFLGEAKGRYDLISPNNHANMAQSTNDSFPTGIKVCINRKSKKLIAALTRLSGELDKKSVEFKDVLKMGRTHLQDAVPITLGQEMGSYASAVRRGIRRIEQAREGVHVINMGGTAVGTGLNAEPQYIPLVAQKLSEVTGEHYETAEILVKTGVFRIKHNVLVGNFEKALIVGTLPARLGIAEAALFAAQIVEGSQLLLAFFQSLVVHILFGRDQPVQKIQLQNGKQVAGHPVNGLRHSHSHARSVTH